MGLWTMQQLWFATPALPVNADLNLLHGALLKMHNSHDPIRRKTSEDAHGGNLAARVDRPGENFECVAYTSDRKW